MYVGTIKERNIDVLNFIHKKGPNMMTAAKYCKLTYINMFHIINRWETKGIILKEITTNKDRGYSLKLTNKGDKLRKLLNKIKILYYSN